MTLPVTFLPVARAEFVEAAAWYGAQYPGLGDDFIEEIDRCITLAAEQPELYARVHNDIRRVTAHRFPYSVYFHVESQCLVVLAVFHGRRDPTIWQSRA